MGTGTYHTVISAVSDETCGIILTCSILIIKIIETTITITLHYPKRTGGGWDTVRQLPLILTK
jgi:putative component of membrane protein insertase Oxa1/YidC/SpoIIIJ protein YidD